MDDLSDTPYPEVGDPQEEDERPALRRVLAQAEACERKLRGLNDELLDTAGSVGMDALAAMTELVRRLRYQLDCLEAESGVEDGSESP